MCKSRARVFSIRDLLGHRVATVALIFRDDDWHLEQIKGLANADVSNVEMVYFDGERTVTQLDMTDLYYVAHEVLRCYRDACEDNLLKLIGDATAYGRTLLENNVSLRNIKK